jgi:hypothetical protein
MVSTTVFALPWNGPLHWVAELVGALPLVV